MSPLPPLSHRRSHPEPPEVSLAPSDLLEEEEQKATEEQRRAAHHSELFLPHRQVSQ